MEFVPWQLPQWLHHGVPGSLESGGLPGTVSQQRRVLYCGVWLPSSQHLLPTEENKAGRPFERLEDWVFSLRLISENERMKFIWRRLCLLFYFIHAETPKAQQQRAPEFSDLLQWICIILHIMALSSRLFHSNFPLPHSEVTLCLLLLLLLLLFLLIRTYRR